MTIFTLEHNQEEDTFDYLALDLSDPCVLLNTLQKLRQVVVQEGQDIFNQWRSRQRCGAISRIQREEFLRSNDTMANCKG